MEMKPTYKWIGFDKISQISAWRKFPGEIEGDPYTIFCTDKFGNELEPTAEAISSAQYEGRITLSEAQLEDALRKGFIEVDAPCFDFRMEKLNWQGFSKYSSEFSEENFIDLQISANLNRDELIETYPSIHMGCLDFGVRMHEGKLVLDMFRPATEEEKQSKADGIIKIGNSGFGNAMNLLPYIYDTTSTAYTITADELLEMDFDKFQEIVETCMIPAQLIETNMTWQAAIPFADIRLYQDMVLNEEHNAVLPISICYNEEDLQAAVKDERLRPFLETHQYDGYCTRSYTPGHELQWKLDIPATSENYNFLHELGNYTKVYYISEERENVIESQLSPKERVLKALQKVTWQLAQEGVSLSEITDAVKDAQYEVSSGLSKGISKNIVWMEKNREEIIKGLTYQASYIFHDVSSKDLPDYADQANAILAVFAYYKENERIKAYKDETIEDFRALLYEHNESNLTTHDVSNINTLLKEELEIHFNREDCVASEYKAEATAYLHLMHVFAPEKLEKAQDRYNEKVRREERPDLQIDTLGTMAPESKRYIELYESFYDYSLEIPAIDAKIASTMKRERYSTERITQAIQTNSPITVDNMNPTYAQVVAMGKKNSTSLIRE